VPSGPKQRLNLALQSRNPTCQEWQVASEKLFAPPLKNIRVRAFAKINLGLKVKGRRPDGYHHIQTVYQTVTLCDRLSISLAKGGSELIVECDDPSLPRGRQNLVYGACELWRRARHFRGGIRVKLEKKIPAGSGLGGGSSDAAAALLGLERLTGNRLDLAGRLELAARLGSDVPLFLWGGRVLGCGRGEQVYPLWDLPRRFCLVIFPGFSVSTAEAYRHLDRRLAARAGFALTKQRLRFSMGTFGAWPHISLDSWGPAENDFEQVVFARWPELARLKRQLIRAGAETAALTGSGSAVFALFDSAPKLIGALKFVPENWQVFRTRILTRSEYERLIFE
jgi:4-diphosphocytidyl-2-C-methyl-D-erythritol kinase